MPKIQTFRSRVLFMAGVFLLAVMSAWAQTPPALPTVPREFRGIWIATVTNIDWPSTSDSPATQQTKLRAILDKAVELRCNVIVLQVRPACDAFYPSTIEPWSQWLTGQQGRAPNPAWDPLQYAIDQCRARGLELHAWVNPYRAGFTSTSFFHSTHIRNERPDLVRTYGSYYWLDPGHPDVPTYSLSVIMDIVNRYDVDAIHMDDYFYPYPDGTDFPDTTTYAAYNPGGLTLANWRRKNVDDFIQRLYTSIHAAKPHVKFGISPFGIWRPGNPSGIVGLDSYASLYADSKKWFNNGWCDYFSPQLYWQIDDAGQEYPKLLDWWITQNSKSRTLAPGLFTGRVAFGGTPYWPAEDITDQVALTQQRTGAHGNVHFSARAFMTNGGLGGDAINADLKTGVYAKQSLVPASTWLDNTPPAAPSVTFKKEGVPARWRLTWPANSDARSFVVYTYRSGAWSYMIVNSSITTNLLAGNIGAVDEPVWACVSSVDRLGNESARTVIRLTEDPTTWVVR